MDTTDEGILYYYNPCNSFTLPRDDPGYCKDVAVSEKFCFCLRQNEHLQCCYKLNGNIKATTT